MTIRTSLTHLLLPLLLLGLSACSATREKTMKPLATVAHVDLECYLGEWYEIARYPNRFQKDCPASKATYSLQPGGRIEVFNECYATDFKQVLRSVRGTAKVVDRESNAKLKVTFFWPFAGDYWIIDLGEDYRYAVVGHPDRKYLWILSREKTMQEGLYQEILARLAAQGYDPAKLIRRIIPGENHEP
ncbi:MAG: lipocalin family protein [Desulfobulbaceae bacterium]|nr:lipocalin family protein [Desulfobulbaceae bacterium]